MRKTLRVTFYGTDEFNKLGVNGDTPKNPKQKKGIFNVFKNEQTFFTFNDYLCRSPREPMKRREKNILIQAKQESKTAN